MGSSCLVLVPNSCANGIGICLELFGIGFHSTVRFDPVDTPLIQLRHKAKVKRIDE